MSVEKNKENARRAMGVFTIPGLVHEIFAPDYVYHAPTGDVHGPEGFQKFFNEAYAGLTDLAMREKSVVAEGDSVAMVVRFSGAMTGEILGVPPTGKRFDMDVCMLTRHREDGKQVEATPYMDSAIFYQQLGLPFPT